MARRRYQREFIVAEVTQYEVTASDAFNFVLNLSQVFSAT